MSSYQPSNYNFYSDQYDNPTAVNQVDQPSSQFDVNSAIKPFDFGAQAEQSADFRGRFGNFLEGLETPEATRQRFENRYDYQPQVDAFQQSSEALGSLGASISAAPENIKARTAGTMTTQAQLSNIQNKEVGDLIQTYNQLGAINAQQGDNLARIEQNLNEAAQLEMAQQQKMSTPWLMEYDDLALMQAKAFSGWTYAYDKELTRLLANQATGKAWSTEEAERANQLSIAEMTFENNLKQISLRGEEDRKTKQAPTDLATLWSSIMG